MTERERWIVYPLLFLALGAALRDKLFDRTTTKSIVCQELTVVDEEPVANRPVRILAKIGRTEAPSGKLPRGYLLVNGQLEVVDDLARGRQSPPVTLAKLGPAAAVRGVPPGGFLAVNGQVDVQGVVNARQFAYQGMPLVPALRGILPGVSLPDLVHALQQSLQRQQPAADAPRSNAESQPGEEPAPPNDATNGEEKAPENLQRGDQPPTAEPLADPAESR
jgi:hypothetical protein